MDVKIKGVVKRKRVTVKRGEDLMKNPEVVMSMKDILLARFIVKKERICCLYKQARYSAYR